MERARINIIFNMVVFSQKKIITVKSLGEGLVEARESLNLTLSLVEKKIGVGQEYLEAMENGEWQILPGEVYAKSFLQRYALFLGLDKVIILKKFKEETRGQNFWPGNKNCKFGITPKNLRCLPSILRRLAVIFCAVAIVFYLGLQVWRLYRPPKLVVLFPDDNYITCAGEVKILGLAEEEVTIGVNGQEITADKSGFFTIDINLNKGLNVIELEAKKKHGQTTVVYRRILVEEGKEPVAAR